jgi:hypothetical protein
MAAKDRRELAIDRMTTEQRSAFVRMLVRIALDRVMADLQSDRSAADPMVECEHPTAHRVNG